MDKLRIAGGKRLSGRVSVGGAKNASLPEMAASLLTEEPLHLANVPDVWDVGTMRRLLKDLGVECVKRSAQEVDLEAKRLVSHEAPYELVKTMRASVLVLGPLLARHGKARVSLPGGCAIGARPIDLHIEGMKKLGARISLEHGFVEAETDGLRGAHFRFETVTVTGTENLMMAATLARGTTVLENAAREPEVEDLASLLIAMGAHIEGAGTERVEIEGVDRLRGARHEVLPDRIEAGTYLVASALVGEEVSVDRCRPEHLTAVLRALGRVGVATECGESSVAVRGRERQLRPVDVVTEPYPGFPTDMQAQFMVLLTQAEGRSVIQETIFENRFMHVGELARMGARIELQGHEAVVFGRTPLEGAKVMATDLRASACLVLAALAAEGETIIDRVYHLDRGYEHIEEKLNGLGADVSRVA
ncbi:MAG TPA: UDP-N-acetylglucosamine 1-carboxyvinyltransferase [Vicinamibacteria bacterium]|jgi:UDP-N-acetylglucosamine 1-carboxyvinyltransferase